jgi:hypothetical protein
MRSGNNGSNGQGTEYKKAVRAAVESNGAKTGQALTDLSLANSIEAVEEYLVLYLKHQSKLKDTALSTTSNIDYFNDKTKGFTGINEKINANDTEITSLKSKMAKLETANQGQFSLGKASMSAVAQQALNEIDQLRTKISKITRETNSLNNDKLQVIASVMLKIGEPILGTGPHKTNPRDVINTFFIHGFGAAIEKQYTKYEQEISEGSTRFLRGGAISYHELMPEQADIDMHFLFSSSKLKKEADRLVDIKAKTPKEERNTKGFPYIVNCIMTERKAYIEKLNFAAAKKGDERVGEKTNRDTGHTKREIELIAQQKKVAEEKADIRSIPRQTLENMMSKAGWLTEICNDAKLSAFPKEKDLRPHLLAGLIEKQIISLDEIQNNPDLLDAVKRVQADRAHFRKLAPKDADSKINLTEIESFSPGRPDKRFAQVPNWARKDYPIDDAFKRGMVSILQEKHDAGLIDLCSGVTKKEDKEFSGRISNVNTTPGGKGSELQVISIRDIMINHHNSNSNKPDIKNIAGQTNEEFLSRKPINYPINSVKVSSRKPRSMSQDLEQQAIRDTNDMLRLSIPRAVSPRGSSKRRSKPNNDIPQILTETPKKTIAAENKSTLDTSHKEKRILKRNAASLEISPVAEKPQASPTELDLEARPTVLRSLISANLSKNYSRLDEHNSDFNLMGAESKNKHILPHLLAEAIEQSKLVLNDIKLPTPQEKKEMLANSQKEGAEYITLRAQVRILMNSRAIVNDFAHEQVKQGKSIAEALEAAAKNLANNPDAKAGLISIIAQTIEEGYKLPDSVTKLAAAEIANRRNFADEKVQKQEVKTATPQEPKKTLDQSDRQFGHAASLRKKPSVEAETAKPVEKAAPKNDVAPPAIPQIPIAAAKELTDSQKAMAAIKATSLRGSFVREKSGTHVEQLQNSRNAKVAPAPQQAHAEKATIHPSNLEKAATFMTDHYAGGAKVFPVKMPIFIDGLKNRGVVTKADLDAVIEQAKANLSTDKKSVLKNEAIVKSINDGFATGQSKCTGRG